MSIPRNLSLNFMGASLPLTVSFVTIPLYLRAIGEARYGVLAIAWLLLGYFGLFDLGLGRATAQRIATQQREPQGVQARTFWTALALNICFGLIGGLLVWPVASYFFAHIFKVPQSLRHEIGVAVPWLVLAVPMATVSGVLTGALQGRSRFLSLNVISAAGAVLLQIVPLVAVKILGSGLSIIMPFTILSRMVTLAVLFGECWRLIYRGHRPSFDYAEAKELLGFGGWVTVTSFISPIMVLMDRFAIGAVSGAQAVSLYTVPYQLASRSTLISEALASAMFPRLAAAVPEEEQRLAKEGLRALVTFLTPLVVAGIFLISAVLSIWISHDFSLRAGLVGEVVLLGVWFNSLARVPFAQLQAKGRPDVVAKCHLIEIIPYLASLYVGLHFYGIIGAAAVYSLRVSADFGILAALAGLWRSTWRLLVVPGILLITALLISISVPAGRIKVLLCLAHLLVTAVWSVRQAPAQAWAMVPPRFRGRLQGAIGF